MLYDPMLDEKDEKYLREKMGKDKEVLSCGGCFGVVCYEAI